MWNSWTDHLSNKMARARNIKPGFFVNEDLVELPFSTRLLFIGLWTIADREGRLDDRPRKIKMSIFPADDVDVEQGLSELHGASMILRYVVDNQPFIFIPGFVKHQNPHINEQPSVIPAPELHGASTVDATPLTSSLNPDSLNTENAASPPERFLSGRNGIPRTRTPINHSSDLETWLSAIASVIGAKDAASMPKRRQWEEVCMALIRESRDLVAFLKVVQMEKERNTDTPHFFSPDGCRQIIQMNGARKKAQELPTAAEMLKTQTLEGLKPPPK